MGEFEATAFPTGSLEDLVTSSDVVGPASLVRVLDATEVPPTGRVESIVEIQVKGSYRGDDGTFNVVIIGEVPRLENVVVFLRLVRTVGADLIDRAERFGELYELTPGRVSIMDIQEDRVVARNEYYTGVLVNAKTTATESSFSLQDLEMAADSAAKNPVPTIVQPIEPSDQDQIFFDQYDAACAASKSGAAALSELLTATFAAGKFDVGGWEKASTLFADLVENTSAIVPSAKVSGDVSSRSQDANALLAMASETLAVTRDASGKELQDLLVTFQKTIADFQLTWVGMPVGSCKEFV